MSVSNLLNIRILDLPWKKMNKAWDSQTLRDTRKTVLDWEKLYSPMARRIRHTDPLKKPTIPSFAKVDREEIALLITLGGKIMNDRVLRNVT